MSMFLLVFLFFALIPIIFEKIPISFNMISNGSLIKKIFSETSIYVSNNNVLYKLHLEGFFIKKYWVKEFINAHSYIELGSSAKDSILMSVGDQIFIFNLENHSFLPIAEGFLPTLNPLQDKIFFFRKDVNQIYGLYVANFPSLENENFIDNISRKQIDLFKIVNVDNDTIAYIDANKELVIYSYKFQHKNHLGIFNNIPVLISDEKLVLKDRNGYLVEYDFNKHSSSVKYYCEMLKLSKVVHLKNDYFLLKDTNGKYSMSYICNQLTNKKIPIGNFYYDTVVVY